VYASEEPYTAGTRYDPFLYGLKAIRYRVRHFGHCTQWRIRNIRNAPMETRDCRAESVSGGNAAVISTSSTR
jgi:hypothetical protein